MSRTPLIPSESVPNGDINRPFGTNNGDCSMYPGSWVCADDTSKCCQIGYDCTDMSARKYSKDGKCYTCPPGFEIDTAAGNCKEVPTLKSVGYYQREERKTITPQPVVTATVLQPTPVNQTNTATTTEEKSKQKKNKNTEKNEKDEEDVHEETSFFTSKNIALMVITILFLFSLGGIVFFLEKKAAPCGIAFVLWLILMCAVYMLMP